MTLAWVLASETVGQQICSLEDPMESCGLDDGGSILGFKLGIESRRTAARTTMEIKDAHYHAQSYSFPFYLLNFFTLYLYGIGFKLV